MKIPRCNLHVLELSWLGVLAQKGGPLRAGRRRLPLAVHLAPWTGWYQPLVVIPDTGRAAPAFERHFMETDRCGEISHKLKFIAALDVAECKK
ncbi:hypothetical protein V8Z74_19750 [Comamonas sp. w2-DMI]|uniref:hypothetical protein n=1 Tax=Comamonas sp. w2-DMI TaxID=3126391 RepID=UPI0032E492E6